MLDSPPGRPRRPARKRNLSWRPQLKTGCLARRAAVVVAQHERAVRRKSSGRSSPGPQHAAVAQSIAIGSARCRSFVRCAHAEADLEMRGPGGVGIPRLARQPAQQQVLEGPPVHLPDEAVAGRRARHQAVDFRACPGQQARAGRVVVLDRQPAGVARLAQEVLATCGEQALLEASAEALRGSTSGSVFAVLHRYWSRGRVAREAAGRDRTRPSGRRRGERRGGRPRGRRARSSS